MFEKKTINIWSNIYFISLLIAALAGAASLVSGYIQHKINTKISMRAQENIAILLSTIGSFAMAICGIMKYNEAKK